MYRHCPGVIALTAALLFGGLAPAAPSGDEITVTAARLGPRVWQVQGEHSRLWILGTVSPLRIGATWRAGEVKRLLGTADALLAAKPLEISLPRVLWILIAQRDLVMNSRGAKLEDLLAPELYARFSALRAQVGGGGAKWERYRPIIAGALLEDAAMQKNGLSERLDVSLAVRRLARESHLRIDEVKIPGAPDLLSALKTLAPESESRCLAAMLDTVDNGMRLLAERADAWSSGDIERLQALPQASEAICGAAFGADDRAAALLAQIHRRWLESLEAHLQGQGTALAVVDVDLLLGQRGLLAALRADGYCVEMP